MKSILVFLFCSVLFAACGKFEDNTLVPTQTSEYKWNLNGTISHDTIYYTVDQIVLAEVHDVSGQKVNAEFDFSNGSLPTFGNQAADKYTKEGNYKLIATIKSITPAVKLVLNVVVGKKPVVVETFKEAVVVLLSGTSVTNTNTLTLGLNISNLNGYDSASPIYVEASVPGKDWSVYTNATETVIINGFKYVKWNVTCPNGNIRIGWYQYKTVNGLKVKSWAGTSESVYYIDGLPEFSVYNGAIYKLGTTPGTSSVYTLKVNDAAVASGATLKFNEGSSVYFKVVDASGNMVMAKYQSGITTAITESQLLTYNTAGTYSLTATVGTTVFAVSLEIVKVVTPVYTLQINGVNVTSGATINVSVGATTIFQVVDASGSPISALFDFGNGSSITNSGTSVKYAVGDYVAKVTIPGTIFTVNFHVTNVNPVYFFKVNNLIITGNTIYLVEGANTSVSLVDKDNKAVSATFDFDNGIKITGEVANTTYPVGSWGPYRLTATVNGQTLVLNVVVTKIPDPSKSEAIVLVSASVSGSTISAIIGLRCDAINNVSLTKDAYVAGETSNAIWQDYKLSEIVVINNVRYYKWSVSAPVGKFRLGWVQAKDGEPVLYKGNWAYDASSIYWNPKDGSGLFNFSLSVVNGVVKLTAN